MLVDEITRDGFTTSLMYDDETGVLSLVVVDGDADPWTRYLAPEDALDALNHPARYGAPLCRCASCRPPECVEDDDDELTEAEFQELAAS